MIARIWNGRTKATDADAYFDYLNKTGIPDYESTRGNRGVIVLRQIDKDVAHLVLVSLWESLESIKEFAGDDYETAKYYPEDEDFLIELEPAVRHYEVVHSSVANP